MRFDIWGWLCISCCLETPGVWVTWTGRTLELHKETKISWMIYWCPRNDGSISPGGRHWWYADVMAGSSLVDRVICAGTRGCWQEDGFDVNHNHYWPTSVLEIFSLKLNLKSHLYVTSYLKTVAIEDFFKKNIKVKFTS